MNFFSGSPTIELVWKGQEDGSLPKVNTHGDSGDEKTPDLFLFQADQAVAGKVIIKLPEKKKSFSYQSIKLELVGQVELQYDRGNHYVFLQHTKDLAGVPSKMTENKTFEFNFDDIEKRTHESYHGQNARLRYFVRVKISRSYATNITREFDFNVQVTTTAPEVNKPLKMEVGIEDCLHIEFHYDHSKYHLDDVIIGRINFLLVRIKIKHMEMQILKRESTGSGPNLCNETDVITKFEVMDGAPVKGEEIPIRLFLTQFKGKICPTYRTVHNKFSVKYYLNLVLIDEEDRRYFKQQEIFMWRKDLDTAEGSGAGINAKKGAAFGDAITPGKTVSG